MKNIKTSGVEGLSTNIHNPVGRHLGYMLRRASTVIMASLGTSLADIGLRPVEATILSLIATNPDCTQSELGRILSIQRANMVPLITGLVSRGYIGKTAADGRSHALHLTDEGTSKRQEAEAIMEACEARFTSALTEAGYDINLLEDALGAIMRRSV